MFPAFAHRAAANVISLLVRKNTDGHQAIRINCARLHSSAAGVHLAAGGSRSSRFAFEVGAILGSHLRPMQIQCYHLFCGEPDTDRRMRTINSRINQRIELEFNSEFLFGELLHPDYFVTIDLGANGLELQRQPALQQEADSPHAAVVAAGHLSQLLVGLASLAIKRDLDSEGRKLAQIIGNSFVDQGPVGEERDQEALLLGAGVNLKKVFARENLAAGEQDPHRAHGRKFVENGGVFFLGQLAVSGRHVGHREIVVAVLALQRAAPGDFDGNLDRNSRLGEALVHSETEFRICGRFYHAASDSDSNSTSPADCISARNVSTSPLIWSPSSSNSCLSSSTISSWLRRCCNASQIMLPTSFKL